MPKYSLNNRSEGQTKFYAKVIKSSIEQPSQEYISKGGDPNTEQWTTEIKPLYPFQYTATEENPNASTKRSTNMPRPGQAPGKDTPLAMRLDLYTELGFTFNDEEDFAKIEDHIFYYEDEERKFKNRRGDYTKTDAWPKFMVDDFVVPDDVVILQPQSANGGGNRAVLSDADVWKEVAKILDGKDAKTGSKVLMTLVGSGNEQIQGNKEIMSMAQVKVEKDSEYTSKVIETLVAKELGTWDAASAVFTAS